METKVVLNGFCATGKHDQCKGKSRGTKSDPVNFQCSCECHPWNKGQSKT